MLDLHAIDSVINASEFCQKQIRTIITFVIGGIFLEKRQAAAGAATEAFEHT